MGDKFAYPPINDLSLVFKDSSNKTPLVFLLSAGADPTDAIIAFAQQQGFARRLTLISLGQVLLLLC